MIHSNELIIKHNVELLNPPEGGIDAISWIVIRTG
jgi:hypothetical protein